MDRYEKKKEKKKEIKEKKKEEVNVQKVENEDNVLNPNWETEEMRDMYNTVVEIR